MVNGKHGQKLHSFQTRRDPIYTRIFEWKTSFLNNFPLFFFFCLAWRSFRSRLLQAHRNGIFIVASVLVPLVSIFQRNKKKNAPIYFGRILLKRAMPKPMSVIYVPYIGRYQKRTQHTAHQMQKRRKKKKEPKQNKNKKKTHGSL